MDIMIDTEIWSLSVKKPLRDKFSSKEGYDKAIEIHDKARMLVKNALSNDTIYMSAHQIAEIFHVLAYRGTKLPLQFAKKYIKSLIDAKEIVKIEVTWTDFLESIRLSSMSGIHIWDFLCVVPIAEYIDRAYSIDKHFQDPIFKELGIHIENPLGYWMEI